MPWKTNFILLALAFALAPACGSQETLWAELGDNRYQLELAMDDAARTRGLMFRDSLPADQGMLFVFDDDAVRSFWMRNTRIALDILYFDRDFSLVSVAASVPPCTRARCPSYPSSGPARYVLELNAGEARRLGIARGDVLKLSPGVLRRIEPEGNASTSSP